MQNVSKNSLKVVAMFGILSLGMGFLNPISLFAGCSPEQIVMEKANLETQISTLEMMANAPSWRENANTKAKDWETKISKKYPILKSYLNKAQDLVKKELAKNYSLDTQFSFDLEKLALKNSQLTGEITIFTKAIQGVDSENETHYLYGQDQFVVNFDIKTLKLNVSKKAEAVIKSDISDAEPINATAAETDPIYVGGGFSNEDRRKQMTESKQDKRNEYKNRLKNTKTALASYKCSVIKASAYNGYNEGDARNYARQYGTNRNPSYISYTGSKWDCANFVSQSINAGGISQKAGDWWNKGDSTKWSYDTKNTATTSDDWHMHSWGGASSLNNYLWSYRSQQRLKFTNSNNPKQRIANISSQLGWGDVLAIDDKNNRNTNHIMMVTGFYWTNNYGGRNLPLLSAHTGDVGDQRIEDTDFWRNGTWNNLWFIRPIN